MNERIRELAEQAEVWSNQFEEHWGDGPDTYELFKEKFAELIVRECLETIEESNLKLIKRDVDGIYYAVKRHFGVK